MHTARHRPRPRPLAAAALAAATTIAGLAASISPASAFTIVPDHDPDGFLSIEGPMISAVGDTRDTAAIEVAGLSVRPMEGEDYSNGDQRVIVEYTLQSPDGDGGWSNLESFSTVGTVAPGEQAAFAPQSFARPSTSMREEYRVRVLVSWLDSSNFLLGSTTAVPSVWGDAECATGAGVACATTLNGTVSF